MQELFGIDCKNQQKTNKKTFLARRAYFAAAMPSSGGRSGDSL